MFAIQSIIEFLEQHRSDSPLIDRYLELGGPPALETQCNMKKGTDIPSRERWQTDGDYEWCPIRVPRDADTEPYWSSWMLDWPFDRYVEAIGWSGWNWYKRESILFIFDIDADDHEGGLTPEQIKLLEHPDIEWIEVRRSKGGKGIHWYVWLSVPIGTLNHIEHAQLGAYLRDELIAPALGMTAVELQKIIDKTGYIGWLWHKDAAPNGFELLKAAEHPLPVEMIADNWREHEFLPTATASRKDGPTAINDPMKLLQQRIRDAGYVADWVAEIGALRTHKCGLVAVQSFYPGDFQTISPGTDKTTANCWVRQDGDGYVEDFGAYDIWSFQDEPGWEKTSQFCHCKFGAPARFETVGRPKSDNIRSFTDADELIDGMRKLSGNSESIPELLRQGLREFEIARKGKVYQARITPLKGDPDKIDGMIRGKNHWWWSAEPEDNSPEPAIKAADVDRHIFFVKQDNSSQGLWLYDGENTPFQIPTEFAKAWIREATHVADAQPLIDKAVFDYCELTHAPFGPVIQQGPKRKLLNPAPQFKVEPKEGNCDDILSVFEHLGSGIDQDVKNDTDCQKLRITSGADYLLYWAAGVVQRPDQSDVGLTFHGAKNSAKSTLIEVFGEIIEDKGIADATDIVTKGSQFTGGPATAVIGILEEQDCSSLAISNRICDWLTSPRLRAEFKHKNPYWVKNCLHIIQTANDASYAPIFDGDSRFTVVPCSTLKEVDPQFRQRIRAQAPAFLHHLLSIELPPPYARMALPPLENDAKDAIQSSNRNQAEEFAAACLKPDADGVVLNGDLFKAYQQWCVDNGAPHKYETSQQLTNALSRHMTIHNATAYKSGNNRGRRGLTLAC